jgi:hypothetical protein
MSTLKATFNTDSKTWMFQKISFTAGDTNIQFVVFSSEEYTPVKDYKFKVILYKNGGVIVEKRYPEFGFYELVSREPIDHIKHEFIAEHSYSIKLIAEYQDETFEQTVDFTVPRPVSPYPSWVWNGSAWESPLPKPETVYPFSSTWNENTKKWDIVDIATTLP